LPLQIHISAGRELTKIEEQYAVKVFIAWIEKQLNTNITPLLTNKKMTFKQNVNEALVYFMYMLWSTQGTKRFSI